MLKLLDSTFVTTHFPDKTVQVWKLSSVPEKASIYWEYENDGEFIELAQLVTLLRSQGSKEITLHIPFLPYGRQDKEISNTTTFGLASFAGLINSLNLDLVSSLDTHSDKAGHYINNFVNIFPDKELDTLNLCNYDFVCFPDHGAYQRYGQFLFGKYPLMHFNKLRDSSGNIVSLDLTYEDNIVDTKVILIDDICDGGATFIKCADFLYSRGVKSVDLYTTHGLYSKGKEVLKNAKINNIYNRKELP